MTGPELQYKRKSLGYTQSELATIMERSRATISRWETSEEPIDHLAVLCIGTLEPKRREAS